MIALMELLERRYPTGLYLLGSDLPHQAVEQIVEQAGFNFLYIDGQKINTVEEFFVQSSIALKFPDYHSQGWNAFADFLKDLDNIPPAEGDVIMYDEFQRFAHNDAANFFIAVRHFESIAQETDTAYPLYVLLRASEDLGTNDVTSHLQMVERLKS